MPHADIWKQPFFKEPDVSWQRGHQLFQHFIRWAGGGCEPLKQGHALWWHRQVLHHGCGRQFCGALLSHSMAIAAQHECVECCLQYCNVLLGLSSCAVRLCGGSAGCVGNGRRQVGRAGGLCQEGLCSGTTLLHILSLYSQDFMQASTLPDMTAVGGWLLLFLFAGSLCKVLRGET